MDCKFGQIHGGGRSEKMNTKRASFFVIFSGRLNYKESLRAKARHFWDREEKLQKSDLCECLNLGAFASDSPGELDVLWHNGDTLGVDGAQVGVFKQTDQVSFAGFLKSSNGCALKPEISFEVLSNLPH
jgi:hypothetical protein